MRESRENYSIVMRDLKGHYAVLSNRAFKTGEEIGKIRGEITRKRQNHSLQIQPGTHIIDLDFAGYLTHSCEPNARVDINKMVVVALRPIQPDEYIQIDFAETEDQLLEQFHCNCGTKQCRGWIVGNKELPYGAMLEIKFKGRLVH